VTQATLIGLVLIGLSLAGAAALKGCQPAMSAQTPASIAFTRCDAIGDSIKRCESQEAICFHKTPQGGLSCVVKK
jgi:hypothetical protein